MVVLIPGHCVTIYLGHSEGKDDYETNNRRH